MEGAENQKAEEQGKSEREYAWELQTTIPLVPPHQGQPREDSNIKDKKNQGDKT